MKDSSYAKMGYPVVSQASPFLNVTVRNVNLRTVVPVGAGLTYARVYRVGELSTALIVNAVEVIGNTFKFIMPAAFLSQPGGRYSYELFFSGNYIGQSQFQYNKVDPTFEDSLRV